MSGINEIVLNTIVFTVLCSFVFFVLIFKILNNRNYVSKTTKEKESIIKSELKEFRETKKVEVKSHLSLHIFEKNLEKSFSSEFKENLFERLKPKFHSYEEWDQAMIGVKEFFILNKFMKNVPMYNEKVDEIWHQMILFTKDYADFCHSYYGHFLHHQPHVGKSKPQDPAHTRFLFDLIYSLTFNPASTTEVEQRWGKMMTHTWDKKQLLEWRTSNPHHLKEKYFQVNKETEPWIDELISKIKKMIDTAEKNIKDKNYSPTQVKKSKNAFVQTDEAILSLFIFCLIDPTLLQEEAKGTTASSDDSNHHHGNNSHDSHDGGTHGDSGGGSNCSGGTSCSSCGGGCGS